MGHAHRPPPQRPGAPAHGGGPAPLPGAAGVTAIVFSSLTFLAFFALYYPLHRLIPPGGRLFLIIAGSAFFYGWWNPLLVWLPFLLMVITQAGAVRIAATAAPATRRGWLATTLILLFLPLLGFKYTNFIHRELVGPWLGWSGNLIDLPLPLGISFITFTLAAYVVEVYRNRYPCEESATALAGYVLFFPHLIAGPILRPWELLPQLHRPSNALGRWRKLGLALFTLGLVKKIVLADQLAPLVDKVYAGSGPLGGWDYLLAIYGFSCQIYNDFSGYTDMALGLALLLGVRLPVNFRQPYLAASVAEFWRRWHITLSHWLRDYLYIPLGGGHGGRLRQARNILITMALGGLWHGANWTFLLWGLFHAAGILLSHLAGWREGGPRRGRWLGILATFHVVTVGWVLFRAPDLATAARVLAGPFTAPWGALDPAHLFPLLLILAFLLLHPWDDQRRLFRWAGRSRAAVFYPVLAILALLAATLGAAGGNEFIYFDF